MFHGLGIGQGTHSTLSIGRFRVAVIDIVAVSQMSTINKAKTRGCVIEKQVTTNVFPTL